MTNVLYQIPDISRSKTNPDILFKILKESLTADCTMMTADCTMMTADCTMATADCTIMIEC